MFALIRRTCILDNATFINQGKASRIAWLSVINIPRWRYSPSPIRWSRVTSSPFRWSRSPHWTSAWLRKSSNGKLLLLPSSLDIILQLSYKLFKNAAAISIACWGRSPWHLMTYNKTIIEQRPSQFVVAKGHNIWKVPHKHLIDFICIYSLFH